MNCRFCQLIQENTEQVYRDELLSVFLDIDPISSGHVLIMPNAHYLDLDDLPAETLNRMLLMARHIVGIYKEQLKPPGYSMMQNGGQFNDVGHFHLHLFPRYDEQHFNFTYEETAAAFQHKRQEMQQRLRLWLPAGLPTQKVFPLLRSERLDLNQLTISDTESIVQLAGNENIARTTLNIPHPYSAQDAAGWINSTHRNYEAGIQYTFAIRKSGSSELVGAIGLILIPQHQRAEVGYWMGEPYWNQGYTSEALAAVLRFGFTELNLNKIYATHLLSNLASGKVMIKNGMVLEGELMAHYVKEGVSRNVKQYRLLKSEWEKLTQ